MVQKKLIKTLEYLSIFIFFLFLLHPGRFSVGNYSTIPMERIESSLLKTNFFWTESPRENPLCPPLDFEALKNFDTTYFLHDPKWISLNESAIGDKLGVLNGGSWSPKTCISLYESVIIIPYRERESHLSSFIKYIHPFLQAQNISYRLFVIEQAPELPFNRGMLFNIGFLESSTPEEFPLPQCVIFHDVDLIPMDARNIYGCSDQPRHMSSNVDSMRFNLPNEELFGGAVSIPAYIYREVNGFSNRFYGWGAEDDDFYFHRLRKKFPIIRFPPEISSYRMLPHIPAIPNPNRHKQFKEKIFIDEDGLSTSAYEIIHYEKGPLFTKLTVEV
ncbi:beta-1,4-galactosyltransferase 1 isoform X2 [Lepeophtheirus salmonis]|uniref:beta-1,4-galactosyltransferase 1 isoform X2 n=1 Tax=Lepeophtheirus salmonis TaxID=72036 RepID=UPI001AE740E6|nr:beta-1,4-galactosyltransferase 1-like isoform X2 [Lepeophtheirus salmonis]